MCNCRVEGRNFFSLAYCGACAKLLYVPIHCSDDSVTFYIDTYVHVLHACFCKRERVKIRVCYLIIKSFVLIACLHFYVCSVFLCLYQEQLGLVLLFFIVNFACVLTAAVRQQIWCIFKMFCSYLGTLLSYSNNNHHLNLRTSLFVYLRQLNHTSIIICAPWALYPRSNMLYSIRQWNFVFYIKLMLC